MTYAVPFATTTWDEIAPGLYQGGHTYAPTYATRPVVVRDEFDLVVSLYTCWGHGPADGVEELRATIPDGALSIEQMAKVVALVPHIVTALGDGKKVLVRCQAGYNRSGLVVGLVLMTLGVTADEAIKLIRDKRSEHALCNPHFVDYLRINEWSNANPASVGTWAATYNAALDGAPVSEKRCELTELLVDQCAHCRCPKALVPADPFSDPAEREYADAQPAPGRYFTAAFDGRCSGCGARFEAFDQIRADGFGGYFAECCGGAE